MKRLLLLLIVLLSLCGCVPSEAPATMPEWVVMLTSGFPSLDYRCSGALIDSTHVITAFHCGHQAVRAASPTDQEAMIDAIESTTGDITVLRLRHPIVLSEYAPLARVDPRQHGYVYGTCPFYWSHVPRSLQYSQAVTVPSDQLQPNTYSLWVSTSSKEAVCGGDSGGVIVQHGAVVDIIDAVYSETPYFAYGYYIFSIPVLMPEQLPSLEIR